MPKEARRASWALPPSPAGVIVPGGTAKPPGSTLLCSSCLFFGFKVKVRYTVWPRISVGSVRFCFVRSSSSSSFVEFRGVSTRSSFRLSSFAPFGAYETCFSWSFWALLPLFWQFGCCCHGGWGGRCVGLLAGLISVRFWLSRPPSTLFGSLRFELCSLWSLR